MPRDQLGKLRIKRDLARLSEIQERQLIQHIRQPLALTLIGGIQSPQGIPDRLIAQGCLGRQGHLRHVHDRTTDHEILGKLIIQVQTDHRLTLHIVGRLVLQGDTDRRSTRNNTLIQDRHNTGGVIDRIIHILGQDRATRRHPNRTSGHIGRAQVDLRTR